MIRIWLALVVLAGAASQPPESQRNPAVIFETEKGAIEMEVDAAHAPVTAANFLKYVDGGFFDGGSVIRAVPVISQGFAAFGRVVRGMDVVKAIQASPTGPGGPYKTESLVPPIKVLKAYRRKEAP